MVVFTGEPVIEYTNQSSARFEIPSPTWDTS